MNYITEINAFYDSLETNPLQSPDIVLWFALMSIANKTGWQKEFTVAVSILKAKTGLANNKAVERARNKLNQYGYIEWRKRSGNQSAIYSINSLCDKSPYQNVSQPVAQSVSQTVVQPVAINKLNKTKLNNNTKKKILKEKSVFGSFANVYLSDNELDKLKHKYPDHAERIESLSEYIESTGKKYSSHYATILSWDRMNKAKGKQPYTKPQQKTTKSPYSETSVYDKIHSKKSPYNSIYNKVLTKC